MMKTIRSMGMMSMNWEFHEEMEEFRLEFTVSSVCRGDIFGILTTTNHYVVGSGTLEVLLECNKYKQAYLIMPELTGTCDL